MPLPHGRKDETVTHWRDRLPDGWTRFQVWQEDRDDDSGIGSWVVYDTQPSEHFPDITPSAMFYCKKEKKARRIAAELNQFPTHTVAAVLARAAGVSFGFNPDRRLLSKVGDKDK